MSYNAEGEVYGWKALNFALIGLSVIIMLGVLWQPAASNDQATKVPTVQIEQVVEKAPVSHPDAG